jgi:hypothetical protein
VIVTVQVVGVAAAAAAALQRRPRMALAVSWMALLTLAGLRASRGKILHPDVLVLLATVPLLFAPADARASGKRRAPRFGAPLRGAMAVVAIGYFFTGYQKLVTSGWEWVTTDNLRWVMYRAANIYSGNAPGVARWIADRPLLCHLVAATTIVVECGAPLALWLPRLRLPFVVAVTSFHASIWLFLGLDYSMWIAIVWVVFVDWERVADALGPKHRLRDRVVTEG